jgi:hypothetical protein
MRLALWLTLALRLCAQTDPQEALFPSTLADIPRTTSLPPGMNAAEDIAGIAAPAAASGILPSPRTPGKNYVAESPLAGVDWSSLFRASARFLAIEHGFRLLTEPGTRSGLTGSPLDNYGNAVGNLHGWADGDPFYVNYVGHSMQGSVAGFLWVQNDRRYRSAEFGRNRLYWRSRLRAAAFAWAYSEQFEIGPLSEASIGAIQAQFPQQGFVDHVVTPTIGLAWMIAEDAVDKYLIERIESATGNRLVRLVSRSAMNPSRTFANILQGNVPWQRQTRAGVLSFVPAERRDPWSMAGRRPVSETRDVAGPAPFEFAMTFRPERYFGGNVVCLGGGGSAALRISEAWQLIVNVGGCKMMGLEENLSGDSLTYVAGPRFRTRDRGRWSANLELLAGGNKLTEERMFPQTKQALEMAAARDPRLQPPSHNDYTDDTASNGFAVRGGGGVNYKLNGALTFRVAELAYQHSWAGPLWGRSYSNALIVSSGLVLRMGTW